MAKRKNFIARYFKNFGLKQISEILLFIGLVALIVSLFFTEQVEFAKTFMAITIGVVALGFALGFARHLLVVLGKKLNRRSPEFKNALVNAIVSGALTLLAIVGLIIVICN